MSSSDLKLLFMDVEATGINKNGDFVIQLAAIRSHRSEDGNHRNTGFNAYVKPPNYPDIPWSDEVEEKTGIPFDAIENFREEDEVLIDFIHWMRGGERKIGWHARYILVAYNAMYDFIMLERMFKRHGLYSAFNEFFLPCPLDLFTYSYGLMHKDGNPSALKLEDMLDKFNVDYVPEEMHDARADTKALYRLFGKMEEQNRIF